MKNLQASGRDLSRHCLKGLRRDQWNFHQVSRHPTRRLKRTLVNTAAALNTHLLRTSPFYQPLLIYW